MTTHDTALAIKSALSAAWASEHTTWIVTLHVDDDYLPKSGEVVLLVADDGGAALRSGSWLLRKIPRRPTIRLTAFSKGRSDARWAVAAAVDWLLERDDNVPHYVAAGIARIEDVSDSLITRDRATGAYLASITMPVIVRPSTAAD